MGVEERRIALERAALETGGWVWVMGYSMTTVYKALILSSRLQCLLSLEWQFVHRICPYKETEPAVDGLVEKLKCVWERDLWRYVQFFPCMCKQVFLSVTRSFSVFMHVCICMMTDTKLEKWTLCTRLFVELRWAMQSSCGHWGLCGNHCQNNHYIALLHYTSEDTRNTMVTVNG